MFNEVLGAEVSVPESPGRIVSFSPAATETPYALGLGEKVVGVGAFCARPPEAKAKRHLGSYNTVRDEVIEGLDPDLILTVTGYQRDFAVRLSKKFPVYPLELPTSVAGIVDFVIKVGLVVGEPDRGRGLGDRLLRMAGSLKGASGLSGCVEIDLGGPVTFGSYSYVTDAFRLLGCSLVYERRRSEWLPPDFGEVAASDPDLLVYEPKIFAAFSKADLVRLVQSRGWSALRAVSAGNLFLTPGPLDFLAHHGPSFITEALPWLEQRLMEAKDNLVA